MSKFRFNKITTPSAPASGKGDLFYSSDQNPDALTWQDESGNISRIGGTWRASNPSGVSAGFAADTYLAGSKIDTGTIGKWQVNMVYRCTFDMVKTGAGTATPIVVLRIGALGTTGDAAILTFTFGAGTGVIDSGIFTVEASFTSIGSGTSAVVRGYADLKHQLASTGLTSTGTAGYAVLPVLSSGFDSTTSNFIGVSFNGGASFSGTLVSTKAELFA